MRVNNLQRGDTMIEMAITFMILGVVILTVFMAANKSLVTALGVTERTSVRDKINSQLEMSEYVRDWESGYSTSAEHTWADLLQRAKQVNLDSPSVAAEFYSDNCRTNNQSFWLEYDSSAGNVNDVVKIRSAGDPGTIAEAAWQAQTGRGPDTNVDFSNNIGAQNPVAGFGVWLSAGYSGSVCGDINKEPYIDIVARACWTPLGARSGDMGRARLKTVKRLSVVKGREILCGR